MEACNLCIPCKWRTSIIHPNKIMQPRGEMSERDGTRRARCFAAKRRDRILSKNYHLGAHTLECNAEARPFSLSPLICIFLFPFFFYTFHFPWADCAVVEERAREETNVLQFNDVKSQCKRTLLPEHVEHRIPRSLLFARRTGRSRPRLWLLYTEIPPFA